MKQKHNISDEQIIELYDKHKMLTKIAAELQVPPVTIYRRCMRLGLKFKNGGNQKKIPLQEILEGKHPQYQTRKLKIKLLEAGIFENKCNKCGIDE